MTETKSGWSMLGNWFSGTRSRKSSESDDPELNERLLSVSSEEAEIQTTFDSLATQYRQLERDLAIINEKIAKAKSKNTSVCVI